MGGMEGKGWRWTHSRGRRCARRWLASDDPGQALPIDAGGEDDRNAAPARLANRTPFPMKPGRADGREGWTAHPGRVRTVFGSGRFGSVLPSRVHGPGGAGRRHGGREAEGWRWDAVGGAFETGPGCWTRSPPTLPTWRGRTAGRGRHSRRAERGRAGRRKGGGRRDMDARGEVGEDRDAGSMEGMTRTPGEGAEARAGSMDRGEARQAPARLPRWPQGRRRAWGGWTAWERHGNAERGRQRAKRFPRRKRRLSIDDPHPASASAWMPSPVQPMEGPALPNAWANGQSHRTRRPVPAWMEGPTHGPPVALAACAERSPHGLPCRCWRSAGGERGRRGGARRDGGAEAMPDRRRERRAGGSAVHPMHTADGEAGRTHGQALPRPSMGRNPGLESAAASPFRDFPAGCRTRGDDGGTTRHARHARQRRRGQGRGPHGAILDSRSKREGGASSPGFAFRFHFCLAPGGGAFEARPRRKKILPHRGGQFGGRAGAKNF